MSNKKLFYKPIHLSRTEGQALEVSAALLDIARNASIKHSLYKTAGACYVLHTETATRSIVDLCPTVGHLWVQVNNYNTPLLHNLMRDNGFIKP
jgi:hypothetical protein